jgi:hypothetical protein
MTKSLPLAYQSPSRGGQNAASGRPTPASCCWAGQVQWLPANGNPYGVSGISHDQPNNVDDDNLAAIRFQAERTLQIAEALKVGLEAAAA